ncbi:MAG: calcium/sodium antiporter [Pirellulales bacterium]|nr:calcium/sodium antiporter [Pirellulales bacterium]
MLGEWSVDFQILPVWVNALVILGSVVVVGLGAHWLVESAARIANKMGVSELVIGLTIVAMGTSAPEFAVTLIAAFKSQGDISVGNIVGSNIFNLGFILGGCALVRAIPTSPALVRRDGLVLGGSTLLLLAMIGWNLRLDRLDGALLLVLLGIYLAYLFKSRHAIPGTEQELDKLSAGTETKAPFLRDGTLLALGLVCIIVGSHLLVDSASAVAKKFGISEWVIGVTIVAAGTSVPEFATSLMGVLKGRYGISAGNVIGSDIFNVLGVLGLAGLLHPVDVDPMSRVSLAALSGMVFIVVIFMRTGWRISRLEGLALVIIAAMRWLFDFSAHSP